MPRTTARLAWIAALAGALTSAQAGELEDRAFAAIEAGDRLELRDALAEGFDPRRAQDAQGRVATELAIRAGQPAVLHDLFQAGASHLYTLPGGKVRLLHLAAQEGCTDCVKLLLDRGHPKDERMGVKEGKRLYITPLALAAKKGHVEALEVLMLAGANLNNVDAMGRTPLAWAQKEGHGEVEAFLKRKGATADPKVARAIPLFYEGPVPGYEVPELPVEEEPAPEPPVEGERPPCAPKDAPPGTMVDMMCDPWPDEPAPEPPVEDDPVIGCLRIFGFEGSCEEFPQPPTPEPTPEPPPETIELPGLPVEPEPRPGPLPGIGDPGIGGPEPGLPPEDRVPPQGPGARAPVLPLTAGNVLAGGPLGELWQIYRQRHPELGLNELGHQTRVGGARYRGGSRRDSLSPSWIPELRVIARELGWVRGNPQAPVIVEGA